MQVADFLTRLRGVKKSSSGWTAFCPSHDDKKERSLSITEKDGKLLVHCFVGCSCQDVCKAIDFPVNGLFADSRKNGTSHKHTFQEPITLAALAYDKKVPEDFLRSLGLTELNKEETTLKFGVKMACVHIPYSTPDQTPCRQRLRTGVKANGGSLWSKDDSKIVPYGIWREKKEDYTVIVEGESDSWSLWVSGFPGIGLPGAQMTDKLELAHVAHCKKIYVVQESDKAGKEFVGRVQERLAAIGYTGKLFILTMPQGCKDPNDLYRRSSEAFPKAFAELLDECADETELEKQVIIERNKVAPFPIESLPPLLQLYCKDAAQSICCPVDFIATPLLTTLGGVIGNSKRIAPKADWQEGAALYSAIVGCPASKKSPALNATSRFLRPIEDENRKINDQAEIEYEHAMLDYDLDLKEYKSNKDKTAKKPEHPEKPKFARLHLSDVTVESVAEILEANPRGAVVIKDELTSWITGQNQYKGGKGSDKQFYLSVWNNSSAPVDRKGQKTKYLPQPLLAITGNLPPKEIEMFKNGLGDGFIDRILFSYPDPTYQEWSDAVCAPDIKEQMQELFSRLYRDNREKVYQLAPDAKEAWVRWYNDHCEETRKTEEILQSPWGKMPGQFLRIALILAVLNSEDEVSLNTIQETTKLIVYFKTHLRKVMGMLEEDLEEKRLRKLIDYAKKRGLTEVNCRDLARNGFVKKTKDAKETVEMAASKGLGKIDRNKFIFAEGVLK